MEEKQYLAQSLLTAQMISDRAPLGPLMGPCMRHLKDFLAKMADVCLDCIHSPTLLPSLVIKSLALMNDHNKMMKNRKTLKEWFRGYSMVWGPKKTLRAVLRVLGGLGVIQG